jgi:centrosomal protein CEP104
LDPNQKSGYQARELKSVFIDAKAYYLKIALHKCHANQLNMFNQVGLIAINVLGDELDEKYTKREDHFEMDPQTTEKLKILVSLKEKAVSNEDFDEAKKIREAIDRLRLLSQQLYLLEERKKTAITNEDYDSAKVLKNEIDRIRNSVLVPNESFRPTSSSQGMTRPASKQIPYGNREEQRTSVDRFPAQRNDWNNGRNESGNDRSDRNEWINERNDWGNEGNDRKNEKFGERGFDRPGNEDRQKRGERNERVERVERVKRDERRESAERPIKSNRFNSYDEQVIPAAKNSKQIEPQVEMEEERPTSPEGLNQVNRRLAEPFIHILTEYICKKIFSKSWQLREEGLSEIQGELAQGEASQLFLDLNPQQKLSGALAAVRFTVTDKVAQVSLKSMSLLVYSLKSLKPLKAFIRGEVGESISLIQAGLLEKLGDVNSRVRETAELAFFTLGKSELLGIQNAVQVLLKQNKERPLQAKQLQGRLSILAQIVMEFRIDNQTVQVNPVVEYAVQGYLNQNQEVKAAAQQLLAQVFGCIGSRLVQMLGNSLRPAQLEALMKQFSDIEIGNYQETAPKSKPVVNERPMCRFCGLCQDSFASQDSLDLHYWKNCPMLVACLQCSQVVEILHLNSHMVRECELRELVGSCPRCKEAILLDELDMHVDENACLPFKPLAKANRCPLCHDDVDAGPQGWLKHILTEGCPNNDRNPF